MREIKFRYWEHDFKRMVIADSNNTFELFEQNYYPVMQFTGLKDSNGKEIYEGDIVARFQGKQKSYIGFKQGEFIAWIIGEAGFVSCRIECEGCEIIGNIYENPDLLVKP